MYKERSICVCDLKITYTRLIEERRDHEGEHDYGETV